MPSHKTLKSVVTSFAESFTSLMNYCGDDYAMGHIVLAAWSTGSTRLRVDLVNGATDNSPLLVPEVSASVARYVEWFPDLVRRSNSSVDFIAAAELVVTVDPTTRRRRGGAGLPESPFTGTVRVIDDRGRAYVHEIEGWWYPERTAFVQKTQLWWKFWLSGRE